MNLKILTKGNLVYYIKLNYMKINIETISHGQQRYPTPGDYWYDEEGTLQVRISDLGNELYEKMIAIHEATGATRDKVHRTYRYIF